jgi:hypothetical protein
MLEAIGMADWRCLIERLAEVDRSLRLTWLELDSLVDGLPASASNHRAWWSGDRAHVRAWRDAGFTVDQLVLGHEVTFVRADHFGEHGHGEADQRTGGVRKRAAETREHAAPGQVLLIACVKSKLTQPAAAKDLYVSPLFARERRYAESRGVPWFILSGEHALVAPDEWLSPYERYLPDTPASYRAAWGRWVAERLDLLVGPLAGTLVEIHAGEAYVNALAESVVAKGATLLTPLAGLSMGQRLSWYDANTEPISPGHTGVAPGDGPAQASPIVVPGDDADAATFIALLLDRSHAITPAAFLASRRAELEGPGLYSWWVDEPGAGDLSRGLGLPVPPGLVYAGLAGATRWPSGRRSTNSLWSRIAGMHLGGRHEFSTFRRTLGSILAAAHDHAGIDEVAVTGWMMRHLTVRTAPHDDPDALGRLESAVLRAIDPPLNLQGMPETPIRVRLRELRRRYGRT